MPVTQFEELAGSPRWTVGPKGFQGTREFKIPWGEQVDFTFQLVGWYVKIGGAFHFIPPAPFPGVPQAICTTVHCEPFADSPLTECSLRSLTTTYTHALITAHYSSILDELNKPRDDAPDVPQGTFLRWTQRHTAEQQTVPGRTWYWDAALDTLVAPDLHPGILLPTTEHILQWSKVPLPPFSKIREHRGKLNATTFLGAQPETVLFADAEIEVVWQLDGSRIYTLTYHFLEQGKHGTAGSPPTNLKGWNHFYRERDDSGEHWLKIFDENGNEPYQLGELAELFEFES